MKSLFAFIKKDFLEQSRSGKLLILGILFVLFGIMNPAIAKLTPWLLEFMTDSLAESGMIVTEVTVTALDSWVQFFKNIPMGLIIFVLFESSILTKEYNTGTLIPSLTKGLKRFKVIISKMVILTVLWSLGYWLHFGITYAYNEYFWNNSIAQNLLFSVLCWWLFGIFVISLMILFSALSTSNTGVLLGAGSVILISCLVGLLPKVNKFVPTLLTDGNSLIYGISDAKNYSYAIIITAILSLLCFIASIPLFNKKQL